MTLGGLALAVGILVDDATVTIENIERYLEEATSCTRPSSTAPRRSPFPRWFRRFASASCFCRCFSSRRRALPLRAPGGSCRLCHAGLLHPLAYAGADAGDVPAEGERHHASRRRNSLAAFQRGFERGFERVRCALTVAAGAACAARVIFVPVFLVGLRCCAASDSVAGSELLPSYRQRLVHSAHSRQDRYAHRRDGPALRSGGRHHPPDRSRQRDGQHSG